MGFTQHAFGFFTADIFIAEVDKHEVVIGAAGDDLVSFGYKGIGHGLCVGDHLFAVVDVFGMQVFTEGNSLGGDHMLERTALGAGENGAVKYGAHHLHFALGCGLSPWVREVFAHHDHTAAWTAQGFVGGGGHDVAVGHRVVEQLRGDESCGMRNIGEQEGAYGISDGAEAGVIPVAGIGAGAADDELRFFGERDLLYLVHIDAAGLFLNGIKYRAIQFTGKIHGRAMREVAAMREVEAEEGVAGIQAGEHHGGVGLGAAVGLYVGILSAE